METSISRDDLIKFRNDLFNCGSDIFYKFIDTLVFEELVALLLFRYDDCLEIYDLISLIRNKFYLFIN